MSMLVWLEKAKRRGCPLVVIESYDTERTIGEIWRAPWLPGDCIRWDCLAGSESKQGQSLSSDVERFVQECASVADETVIVAQWWAALYEWHGEQGVVQGLRNLRSVFKQAGSMLVLVGQGILPPAALRADFLVYRESLPGTEELSVVVRETQEAFRDVSSADLLSCESEIIDALRGMTQFEAEQQLSMAIDATRIDIGALWEAKRYLINDTPGLECWQGGETAAQLRGMGAYVEELERIRDGREPKRLVIWVDEAEDVLAGVQGDTSGISQYYSGVLAKHIQDTRAQCMVLAGQPGTGKSMSAKVAGSIFGCFVLALDLGACKGGIVGQSEQQLHHALAVERAIVGGALASTLWLFTSNNPDGIPPKIRSRSTEYFYDLPSEQEGLAIWSQYRGQYEIDAADAFPVECDGWTGREIERCCRIAWQYRCSLAEAGRRVVPIKVSQAAGIDERRKQASGKFLSPSKGGVYVWQGETKGRKVKV